MQLFSGCRAPDAEAAPQLLTYEGLVSSANASSSPVAGRGGGVTPTPKASPRGAIRVTGKLPGADRRVELTWRDGVVRGDQGTLRLAESLVPGWRHVELTPAGPTYEYGLDEPYRFAASIASLLDRPRIEVLDPEGLPPWPDSDAGANPYPD